MTATIEVQDALRSAQEKLPWVLQKKEPNGSWRPVGKILPGRMAALEVLNKTKDKEPKNVWRVLPKNESDKYTEGLRQGLAIGRTAPARKRRPLMSLPEKL